MATQDISIEQCIAECKKGGKNLPACFFTASDALSSPEPMGAAGPDAASGTLARRAIPSFGGFGLGVLRWLPRGLESLLPSISFAAWFADGRMKSCFESLDPLELTFVRFCDDMGGQDQVLWYTTELMDD